MVNFLGTELILQNHQIPRDKVSSFEYRGHGWPGYMTAVLRDNSRLVIPLIGNWNSYWPVFSTFMFTPMRCTMCPDQSGEFADISLGDAWLPELRGDKIGESIIVTRTEIAEKLVSNMTSSKKISLRRIHADKVKQSQALNLTFKKRDLSTRLSMLKLANRSIPDFGNNQSQKHLLSFVRALYIYANIKMSSSKHARHWLANIPFPLFRLYFGLYKLLCKA
jgi:coenzyme F420 hydrogenase subunit beta